MTTFPCHLSTLNSSSPSRERETSLITSLRCENWPFIRTFDTCRSAGGCVPTCPLWQRFPDGACRSLSSGDREIFCGIKDALTAFEEKPGDLWGSTSLSPQKPVPRVVLRLLVSVAWLDKTQTLALPWGGPGRGAALNVKLKASPAKRAYVKTAMNKKTQQNLSSLEQNSGSGDGRGTGDGGQEGGCRWMEEFGQTTGSEYLCSWGFNVLNSNSLVTRRAFLFL